LILAISCFGTGKWFHFPPAAAEKWICSQSLLNVISAGILHCPEIASDRIDSLIQDPTVMDEPLVAQCAGSRSDIVAANESAS